MTNSAKLFLGVDGGQSSTVAIVGDESGRVLGTGTAGPCNHVSTEEAKARFTGAIGGAVAAALDAAGLSRETQFEAACLGLSGGPADKEALAREIVRAKQYRVTHDADVALTGATGGKPGVVVIAGTGSIAFGRNSKGEQARAGGWGYIFGDEGSAFDIVRQALRAILRHEEGWGTATLLSERLLEATKQDSANALLHSFYTPEFPRRRIASLAKVVDDAAEQGDTLASEILHVAGQSLASLQASVRRRLFADDESVPVSYLGGVFESRSVRERFRMLVALDINNDVQHPQFGPAHGALMEAYKLAGITARPTGGDPHL